MTKGSGGPCVGVCVQMGWRGKSAEGGVWVPRGWLLGCRTKVSQAPGPALALISPTPTSPSADLYSEEPGEEEPAWVQTERQQFREFRDLNKDGRLDGSEVGYWVLPPSQDQPLVEANHLLHESDTDKDGRLSKAEILSNWNMFVGSQATNYGEDLTRHHDEL